MIDIIVPTIGRPHRLAGLVENIAENTDNEHRVVFVTESHDTPTIDAVKVLGLSPVINERTPNYAGAVNTAWLQSDADWLFCAADDLVFHSRWDSIALSHADDWFGVIGTNDLLNYAVELGMHSTHSLVSADYLNTFGGVADEGPGSFLPECYDHNFTDTEFIATAKMRARFRPCLESIVEHLHVTTGKVEADETHLRSIRAFDEDSRMYDMRRDVWTAMSR